MPGITPIEPGNASYGTVTPGISEETAPKDFKCMWKKKYSRGRGFKKQKEGKDVDEKLFIHTSLYTKLYDKIKTINKSNKIKTKRKSKKHKSKSK